MVRPETSGQKGGTGSSHISIHVLNETAGRKGFSSGAVTSLVLGSECAGYKNGLGRTESVVLVSHESLGKKNGVGSSEIEILVGAAPPIKEAFGHVETSLEINLSSSGAKAASGDCITIVIIEMSASGTAKHPSISVISLNARRDLEISLLANRNLNVFLLGSEDLVIALRAKVGD